MKGFLYKAQMAMARFMYGRNGVDQLGQAMVWAYLILWLLEWVLAGLFKARLAAQILNGIGWVLAVLALFRMFSKNVYRRREENAKYLQFRWRVKNAVSGAKNRHADREHKYFTCKNCKAVCRVPVGKGRIVITCPKCGAQIDART